MWLVEWKLLLSPEDSQDPRYLDLDEKKRTEGIVHSNIFLGQAKGKERKVGRKDVAWSSYTYS